MAHAGKSLSLRWRAGGVNAPTLAGGANGSLDPVLNQFPDWLAVIQ